MASSIFYTSEFNEIINKNPLHNLKDEKSEETKKKIISVSQSIIKHTKTTGLQKSEIKLLNTFIAKLKIVEEGANSSDKQRLKTYIFALETLSLLKQDYPHLANHPFIFELFRDKYKTTLKDPLEFYVKLVDFQENYLLPAIKNAKTLKEYEALSALVDEFSSSADKLREVLAPKAIEYLDGKETELLHLWNARALQLEPMYQALVTYKKGMIGSLADKADRTKLIKNISYVLNALQDERTNPNFTREEKIAIYNAVLVLETEFSEAGDAIQFPTQPLKRDLGISTTMAPGGISKEDLNTIQKLSKQIIDLRPTIGDANAYPFAATYRTYIDDAKTKQGTIDMLAAGLRAHARGQRFSDSPKEIVKLGQDLLRNKSGQCDHMAAAVIAKIVEHIRQGGRWDADVEFAGNGGHCFVIINRADDETRKKATWQHAVIVDTWLGSIGVHPNYQDSIPSPKDGVISDPKDVVAFARSFGVRDGNIRILKRLSAEELRTLASQRL